MIFKVVFVFYKKIFLVKPKKNFCINTVILLTYLLFGFDCCYFFYFLGRN